MRDSRVKLWSSEEKGTIVEAIPIKPAEASSKDNAAAAAEQVRVQFVITLDLAQWEEYKRYVDPKETLMPHRPDHQHHNPTPGKFLGFRMVLFSAMFFFFWSRVIERQQKNTNHFWKNGM